jgi:hypothetical protein
MLSIFDGDRPLARREMLRIGSLALGGLALPHLVAAKANAAGASPLTGKSVIFVFQQGGPSQFETFDPKPAAPEGIRTVTGVTKTSIPGVIFGDTMEQTAKIAHRLTIVRSYQTNNAGHNIEPLVGPDSLAANIGVHFSRIAGATRAATGMPTGAVIYPASVASGVPGPEARGDMLATGPYGKGFAPFVPGKGGQLQRDMQLNLPRDRFFGDRRAVLRQLDRLSREVDATGQLESFDAMQRQSYELLLDGRVNEALDLTQEDPRTVARYDTSEFAQGQRWNTARRGQRGYYNAQAETIGKLLLLARRLCEAGCGFVTIHADYAGTWDMHADGENLNMVDGMQAVGRSFDHAVAAFVDDVEQRGLSDQIMLVASGEMGRTPRLNNSGGRDHWGKLAPLLLYGGGIQPGVIGQSTRDGGEPQGQPCQPSHLIASILQTVLNAGNLRLQGGVPPQVTRLISAAPIPGLFA